MVIYLDWHIFSYMLSAIESKEESNHYFQLYNKLKDGDYLIPYSPTHLADLKKALDKETKLKFINELTEKLCLAQYWGKEYAIFHKRDALEHFKDSQNEIEFSCFHDLVDIMKTGDSALDSVLDTTFNFYTMFPHNISFEVLEKVAPIYGQLFENSKNENSIMAVIEDIIQIISLINSDYTIYRELRKIVRNGLNIDSNLSNQPNPIDILDSFLPQTAINKSFSEIIFENNSKNNTSKNKNFSLIIDSYLQLDMWGYQADKLTKKNQYQNLFNDASHCFYAAHCDIYINNENRGSKKTIEVYRKLDIQTVVLTAEEFLK